MWYKCRVNAKMTPYRPTKETTDPARLPPILASVEFDLTEMESHRAVGIPPFGWLAMWHWGKAVCKAKRSADGTLKGVDWQAWRTGVEYADLFLRCWRAYPNGTAPHTVTFFLEVAIVRMLTNHPKAAERVLKGTERPIASVVNTINSYSRNPIILEGDLDIIGLLYDRVLGNVPKHRVFHRASLEVTREDLTALADKRKRYAKKSRAEGALLAGYSFELIPLEALFVNSLLPEAEKDATLTQMAQAIAATEYPDDPMLEGYDARLMMLGL